MHHNDFIFASPYPIHIKGDKCLAIFFIYNFDKDYKRVYSSLLYALWC